ncbi:MAG: helix-turn-helix domain-containing protein [Candidatus Nezhaarchaeota archaeon]|nr:helix-turn-helix domain-containing protein [Candidatus Nezhaarchaeota archaeon]
MAAPSPEQVLANSGLTPLEARVYLYLNENPNKRDSEIGDALGIPLPDVRKALSSLRSRGLVKAVERDGYDAVPPSKAFEILVDLKTRDMELALSSIRRQLHSIRESLEKRYWVSRYGISEEQLLESLEDLRSMEAVTARLMAEATEEILVFTASFEWYNKVRETLTSSLQRGVRVRVLMRVVDEPSRLRARELLERGVEVRSAVEGWYPVRGTLVDESRLVFLIWATEEKLSCFRPHYTENRGLIKVFLDSFEHRWARASSIA